ncbi:MAG TPA: response regulator transcription factor [Thermomicrobiales bacterium]|nr:response regulator transcription factor [Thermomicrobiales bacterium]
MNAVSAVNGAARVPVGQATILLVDDDAIVLDVVERYLLREGYDVRVARDGEAGLAAARDGRPDLIVLDLMLPGLNGLEVARRVRAESAVPIIMLTARGEETDKVLGLGLGADDYVTKPFSPRELVARIGAVLRRTSGELSRQAGDDDAALRFGALRIDPRGRTVTRDGAPADLTAREFDLLAFLARHAGQVFTRQQLLDQVWDFEFYGDPSTVTVHVRRLREKIEPDPVRPRYLKTVWGVGYKFDP